MKVIDVNVGEGLGLSPLNKNLYGIEVELEEYQKSKGDTLGVGAKWTITNDDSLRKGVEFVSEPLSQIELALQLKKLEDFIAKKRLVATKRCSNHVHVNVRDLTFGQAWGLLALGTYFEPDIFAAYAKERDENHFCVPTYWNTFLISRLQRDMSYFRVANKPSKNVPTKRYMKKPILNTPYGGSGHSPSATGFAGANVRGKGTVIGNSITSAGRGQLKYGAISLYRLRDLGTLEFRILRGDTNMDVLKEYVKLLGRLKFFARRYKDPLKIQQILEEKGRSAMWASFGQGNLPQVRAEDREEAQEAAFAIIGAPPKDKEELSWNVT